MICTVSYFNMLGLEILFGNLSPPKHRRCDRTGDAVET